MNAYNPQSMRAIVILVCDWIDVKQRVVGKFVNASPSAIPAKVYVPSRNSIPDCFESWLTAWLTSRAALFSIPSEARYNRAYLSRFQGRTGCDYRIECPADAFHLIDLRAQLILLLVCAFPQCLTTDRDFALQLQQCVDVGKIKSERTDCLLQKVSLVLDSKFLRIHQHAQYSARRALA